MTSISSTYPQEVLSKHYNNGALQLVIHKVEIDSFDTLRLTNHNLKEFELTCADNVFYQDKK